MSVPSTLLQMKHQREDIAKIKFLIETNNISYYIIMYNIQLYLTHRNIPQ